MSKKENKLSLKTILAWNSRSLSVAISVVLMMQVTYYSTEALGLATTTVGMLFLAAKVFDGFTDLVVGFIIDRTNTKLGKARPYELFLIPLWVLIVAFFSTPDMGTTGKMIYIFVMYTLIQSVCTTFLQSSETVFMGRAIGSGEVVAKIMSIGGVLVMFGSTIASVALPLLMANWGTQSGGWTKIALVYAVPMLVIGLFRFLLIKEKSADPEEGKKETIGFVEGIKLLTKNKYIFILAFLIFLSFLLTNISSIVGSYYFTYIFGDLGLMSVSGMTGLISPVFFLLFPLATRTIGSLNFVKLGLLLSCVSAALRFFFPVNLPVILVTGLIIAVGGSTLTMMNHYFILQCIDYGEMKTGIRTEGTPAALTNFANKLGSGMASALVGGFMGLFGFVSSASTQTESALLSIRLLYSVVPAVILLIMLITAKFFDVEKVLEKMRTEKG